MTTKMILRPKRAMVVLLIFASLCVIAIGCSKKTAENSEKIRRLKTHGE